MQHQKQTVYCEKPELQDIVLIQTNTILILMHQMRISTTQVSSVMLRSKKLEIREKKGANCERAD